MVLNCLAKSQQGLDKYRFEDGVKGEGKGRNLFEMKQAYDSYFKLNTIFRK